MAAQQQALAARDRGRRRNQLICYLVFQNYLSLLLPRGTWSNM